MGKVNAVPCAPCTSIHVWKVDISAYRVIAQKDGRNMTSILRKASRSIADKYPDDMYCDPCNVVQHMEVRSLGQSGNKIKQICSQLGVSVSDFMKIELYNELVLKKKIA